MDNGIKTGDFDYDEISPISGKKTVFVEIDEAMNDTFKMCMSTGYHTYYKSWRLSNREIIDKIESSMSKTQRDYRFDVKVGGDKVLWYPFSAFSEHAALNPIIDKEHGIEWELSTLTKVDDIDLIVSGIKIYKLPKIINDKMVIVLLAPSNDTVKLFDDFETAYGEYMSYSQNDNL